MATNLATKRLSKLSLSGVYALLDVGVDQGQLTRADGPVKELAEINSKGTPPGIVLLRAEDMQEWIFSIAVLGDETIYRDEIFALRLKFGNRYPIDSPEVTFLNNQDYKPPMHPHVYSNGHICASILGKEWSPVLNAVSVCITMQSMLASNKKKERPQGNDRYVRTAPSNPKDTQWVYHDDTV